MKLNSVRVDKQMRCLLMHIKPIMTVPVSRNGLAGGGRETASLTIKHPSRRELSQLTDLYNSVIDLIHEKGLLITRGQIASRLERDPGSIFAGYVNGSLVGMINVIKLRLASQGMMPTDHQSLTGEDTWSTTDPKNANVWICPWVATHPDLGRGWKGEYAGQTRSLGQLMVRSVAVKATDSPSPIDYIVAYSRPAGLRAHFESRWGNLTFGEIAQSPYAQMRLADLGEIKVFDAGLYSRYSVGSWDCLYSVINYAETRTKEGRMLDPVIRFHIENGARLIRDLIFPYGHTGDQNSLFYRTCLGYRL